MQIGSDPLATFNTYGWAPDRSLSNDVNFLDLTLLITRSSQLRQGSMACILASPDATSCMTRDAPTSETKTTAFYLGQILCAATNRSLYTENDSDIHAEISVLGHAARNGIRIEGCTAYITMPPCKRCFAALFASGVKRVVSRYPSPRKVVETAARHGIEVLGIVDHSGEQRRRVDAFANQWGGPIS
jgi:deoxycytidylate deaminase